MPSGGRAASRPRARQAASPSPARQPRFDAVSTHVVKLPVWLLHKAKRKVLAEAVPFSIVQQIDGLLHKCRGARVECDVFAESASESRCHVYGSKAYESTGSFVGWYECEWDACPRLIAAVKSHRGLGVFIVPSDEGAIVCDLHIPQFSDTGARLPDLVAPWQAVLRKAALIEFVLPEALGVRAIFAQFGANGDFKAKARKERVFTLDAVPSLDLDGPHLGVRPLLTHRVSPLARVPTLAEDVLPARPEGPFEVVVDAPKAIALPSRFTAPAWVSDTAWMDSFPDKRVRELAGEATLVGLHGANAFAGDLSKAVEQQQRNPGHEKTMTILANHMKQVSLGQEIGPTPTPLFPEARILPEPRERFQKTGMTQSRIGGGQQLIPRQSTVVLIPGL